MAKETNKQDEGKNRLKDRRYRLSQLSTDQLIDKILELESEKNQQSEEMEWLRKEKLLYENRLKKYEPKEGSPPDYTGYKTDWPTIKKVQFILQRNFGELTNPQILKELFRLEPFYKQLWLNPTNCLSKILGRACKYELIERLKIPGSPASFYRLIDRHDLNTQS